VNIYIYIKETALDANITDISAVATVLKPYLLLNVINFIKMLITKYFQQLFYLVSFMYYFQNNHGSYIFDNRRNH
jgi:hypothetical protein